MVPRETSWFRFPESPDVSQDFVYDRPCFLFANTMTVLTFDFDMAFWGRVGPSGVQFCL